MASAPNRLWVADLTYVKSLSGWVYAAFIIDVFSRAIVGWHSRKVLTLRVANTMTSDFCVAALCEALSLCGTPKIFDTDRGGKTSRSATPSDSARPAPWPRSVLVATPMTTPWPSRSTATTRAN